MKVPVCRITPGCGDRGADRDGAGHDMRGAEDGEQTVAGVDAVLHGNDAGIGADQWFDLFARGFDVPEFDAEKHDIDGTDDGGIVGGLNRSDQGLAAVARRRAIRARASRRGGRRAPRR